MKEVATIAAAIGRRWITVLLATLLGGVLALSYGLLRTENFQSTATLTVSSTASDQTAGGAYQAALAANQRVSTYAEMVSQSDVLAQVAESSNGRFTLKDLQESVGASAQRDTVLIDITAVNENPRTAQEIARLTAVELSNLVRQIETPPGSQVPSSYLTMVGNPMVPDEPVGLPSWLVIAIGVVAGLIAGLLFALVREYIDRTVRNPESISYLTGLGVLGVILNDPEGKSMKLGRNSETFRHLRTSLGFVDVDNPPRTLLVTSSVQNEGKSYTARRLAEVLAEAGNRVVLVDADLRAGVTASDFGVSNDVGLTHILSSELEHQDVVTPLEIGIDLISTGVVPPNPSELLGSQAMENLLTALVDDYDYVVVDSPPVLPVTDSRVLASRCDAVLFVVRIGRVTTDQAKLAVSLLQKTSANMAGLVVNGTKAGSSSSYGVAAYGYGYGYGAENGKHVREDQLMHTKGAKPDSKELP